MSFPDATMNQKATAKLDVSDFSCAICMELLYKPCVNSCGHTFCFWCFHRSMSILRTEHPCPLCRTAFHHLPAVCWPLHRYLVHNFKEEMEVREKDIQKLEQEEYHAESPSMNDDESNPMNFSSIQEEFKCIECGNLAAPPTVLSCGHTVCCYAKTPSGDSESTRKKRNCPIEGCVGKVVGDAHSTCAIIDKILQTEISPSAYNEAVSVSQKCVGLIRDVESSGDDDDDYNNGDICILHGLGSAKGSMLNGQKVKIVGYNSKSKRYDVKLVAPTSNVKHVSVKTKNLEKIDDGINEEFIHYGVGCDGCGEYPIKGRRYKCQDCSEEIGFDLCGNCLDLGVHNNVGRFNQKHTPDHKMMEVKHRTLLHQIQATNPDVPLPQLLNMIGMQFVTSESEGGDS